MEVSRAQGEQLRVWSNLPCATETEVPPLNAVAAAVWDGGARGLKEGTGIDCGQRQERRMEKRREKRKGEVGAFGLEPEAPVSSSWG